MSAATLTLLLELDEHAARGDRVILADVRTGRSARESGEQAAGAVRLDPAAVAGSARRLDLPRDAWIGLYCA